MPFPSFVFNVPETQNVMSLINQHLIIVKLPKHLFYDFSVKNIIYENLNWIIFYLVYNKENEQDDKKPV
jgi:hypothetical protein